MDIATWLHGLGLQQYEPAFRENAIDASLLPELTAEDLRDIGVNLVGHRRKLLAAISSLRSGVASGSAASPTGGERRQLTVMFCDLVGSTALSVRRDPEDLRDLIGAYHHAVAEVVTRFEGFVARYMGDGILIYFGYPRAHEDDAERAARCALVVIEAVSGLKLAEELRARVGIATGMVVVGGGAPEHDVVGETPNLAARLQNLAEPNTVLIDENTRRLIGGLFEYRNLGAVEARGFTETVSAWQVVRPSSVASRFEALRASSPTPLVGRGEELEFLLRRWERVKKGDGQVVLLSGEPGIGKSRMAAALAERLHQEAPNHLRYFCAPHHQGTPLYPVITHLEHAAGFARDDPPEAKLEKLRQLFGQGRLGNLRRRVAAHAGRRSRNSEQEADLLLLAVAGVRQALVADLLSLPTGGALPEMNLSPQRKKEKTLEALVGLLEDLSRRQPVLMVFEDVHWIDPTSRELLDLTIERIRQLPVLLIITFRPEFEEAWSEAAHVSTLLLNRLDAEEGTVLAETIAGKASTRRGRHPYRRSHRRRPAVCRGADKNRTRKRHIARRRRPLRLRPANPVIRDPAELARFAARSSRPPRPRQPRKSRRSAPPSAVSSPMSFWPRLRDGARQNCKTRSAVSPMLVWCFNAACPRTPRFYSSMRLCRTQPMAPFCAARGGYYTRKSRKR